MPLHPLDPVRFGTEVIDRFASYLTTTFPVAHPDLDRQIREEVSGAGARGRGRIARGPFVFLNRPFEQGPSPRELAQDPDLGLHPALPDVFPFERLHRHQELALRSIRAGRHTLVATGTGSGKTEAFLLPIVDHCLKLRDAGAPAGVVALLVYPMNALADDQLRRLRPLLAGTGIEFGRYTGATPRDGSPEQRLVHSRPYGAKELALLEQGRDDDVPLPFEECWSRKEIQARRPRLLLTNYAQLEYLLLRDKDLDLFRGAPLRFLVLDEVHTYTGSLGSEVACLIRRLRQVARKQPDELLCVGTSATVQDERGELEGEELTRRFAERLFGVRGEAIEVVGERFSDVPAPDGGGYVPPPPARVRELLVELLGAARELHLREAVDELTPEVLAAIERLCGRAAHGPGSAMERAHALLASNRLVWTLQDFFRRPTELREARRRIEPLGRRGVEADALAAEILAYLVAGALVHQDGEPLLRPKLHWFVQGFLGLGLSYDPEGRPRAEFEPERGHAADGALIMPMVLCRSCGQHYAALACDAELSLGEGGGYLATRVPSPEDEVPEDEEVSSARVYVTDELVGRDESEEAVLERLDLCRYCGAVHPRDAGDAPTERCRNPRCTRPDGLVAVHAQRGLLKSCLGCGTPAKGFEEIVTPVRSSDVASITILSQSMLSAMPEETMRRLLVFSDNRQEAAFQAGWMEERSQRFRLRHLLYTILDGDRGRAWSFDELASALVDRGVEEQVLRREHFASRENATRVGWFLAEEFFSTSQRRSSLESLALARIDVAGICPKDGPRFYARWCRELGIGPGDLEHALVALAAYYRRRGCVSHELLRRHWSYQDREVQRGWVRTYEHHHPQALALRTGERSKYVKTWLSTRGQSGAHAVLDAALPESAHADRAQRNELLEDLWRWWTESGVLQRVELVRKQHGRPRPIDLPPVWQLDVERVGLRWIDRRWVCSSCRRAQSVPTPSGRCPEYGCKGRIAEGARPEDHFDVIQYTRGDFVPLLPREHSAQVSRPERKEAELEFKKERGGRYNCLVATPTLELGVDIGKLEMVLHRNVPPTPANYAQRAGRAGRRHRIAVVFTFCGGGSHDRYFYAHPEEMIAGRIRVPAFSMRNEPLVRKHLHSAVLTALRERKDEHGQLLPGAREALEIAFPTWIRDWFAQPSEEEDRIQYLREPVDLSPLERVISDEREELLESVRAVFQPAWPAEDAEAVSDLQLARGVDGMTDRLRRHVGLLIDRVRTWRREQAALLQAEMDGQLSDAEKTRLRQLRHALGQVRGRDQENYALSWLSVDGFFPGYALTRESVAARSLEPFLEVLRPAPIALRELTPSNFLYANRNVFRPRRLFLEGEREGSGGRSETVPPVTFVYDGERGRLFSPEERTTEGGGERPRSLTSYRLKEVEMQRRQDIGDREPYRRRVRFGLFGLPLATHGGGRYGHLGALRIQFLERQDLRLVNLGELRREPERFSLFPLCAVCGETRSARATQAELSAFEKDHAKLHGGRPTGRHALHVELCSDTLQLGPFSVQSAAENVFEALRLGARLVLDMGETALEGFTLPDEEEGWWTVLYDPMPGGSGFIPELLDRWELVCSRAAEALEECPGSCERACYACLMHFWNQHVHGLLDRHEAVNELRSMTRRVDLTHRIPPVHAPKLVEAEEPDSEAELDLAEECRKRSMPPPEEPQHRVPLPDGTYTVADWAWPSRKLLVFVDGMSRNLHGDPRRNRMDRLKRAQCRIVGYQVVEITAEAVKDKGSLAVHLDEIALYLERSDAGQ